MDSIQYTILGVALLVSLTCALPGIFLMLRGVALMSDAISHSIVLGIVVMFLCTQQLNTGLLIIGAAAIGFVMVLITEYIMQTQTHGLKKDAVIGLVFPLFFSAGILLLSMYGRSIHLDIDMVLLGEIAFAPLHHWHINGIDMGPCALWVLSSLLLMNMLGIALWYKELVIATFDPHHAQFIGTMPTVFFYGLMGCTSLTTVIAFDIVGAVVVVALMIIPPAGAYLLSRQMHELIGFTCLIAVVSVIVGCIIAFDMGISIIGSIATGAGIHFILILVAAPEKGLIVRWLHKKRLRAQLFMQILCSYLQTTPFMQHTPHLIAQSLGWSEWFTCHLLKKGLSSNILEKQGDYFLVIDQKYR